MKLINIINVQHTHALLKFDYFNLIKTDNKRFKDNLSTIIVLVILSLECDYYIMLLLVETLRTLFHFDFRRVV